MIVEITYELQHEPSTLEIGLPLNLKGQPHFL